jgi:hypothetical protein
MEQVLAAAAFMLISVPATYIANHFDRDEFVAEDRGVIEAVLHDPRLLKMCGGRIRLTSRTYFWDSVPASSVEPELLASARVRNRRSMSLRAVRPPRAAPGVTYPEGYAYATSVRLSRPGYSLDGMRAIVWVTNATTGGGYTVYAEKAGGGTWTLAGYGVMWEI